MWLVYRARPSLELAGGATWHKELFAHACNYCMPNWEVINRSITFNTQYITHSNNMVTG